MKDKYRLSKPRSAGRDDDMASAALRWLEDEDEEEESLNRERPRSPRKEERRLGVGGVSSFSTEDNSEEDGVDVDYDIDYASVTLGATPRKSKDDNKSVDEAVDALIGTMEKIGPKFLSTPRGFGGEKKASDEKEEEASIDALGGGKLDAVEQSESKESAPTDDGTLVLPWSPSVGEDSAASGRMLTLESSATHSLTYSATLSADSYSGDSNGDSPRMAYTKSSLTPMSVPSIGSSKHGRDGDYAAGEVTSLRSARSWDQ